MCFVSNSSRGRTLLLLSCRVRGFVILSMLLTLASLFFVRFCFWCRGRTQACAKGNRKGQVKKILDMMVEEGVSPNAHSYTIALKVNMVG